MTWVFRAAPGQARFVVSHVEPTQKHLLLKNSPFSRLALSSKSRTISALVSFWMRNSSAQNWNGARFSWSTLNRAQITGLHFELIKKEIVRRIMSHNKLKTRNASLLKNTQPLFCFQNKLPFDLEKVTYVNQDRENQRQPLSLKTTLPFYLKMNHLFLIIGCHHFFFPKKGFFYSKQPKWVFSVQPEFFRSYNFRVFYWQSELVPVQQKIKNFSSFLQAGILPTAFLTVSHQR